MIRLLIVDDERVERIALQRMIEEGLEDVEVAGHACNGREAVEAADQLQPDLILMDIKMPGMSGLQAIELIKESNVHAKFIIVTAFDTFEFARQALRMGVRDYLLKPSRKSVVLETIQKVLDEIKQARAEAETRRAERERLQKMIPIVEGDIVSQLLFDFAPSRHLNEMLELLGLPYCRGAYVMNVCFPHTISEEGRLHQGEEGMADKIRHLLGSASLCWIGRMSGRQLPLIVVMDGEYSYRNQALSLGRKLVRALQRICGGSPFIGIGGHYREVRDIRKSYHEALLASADTTLPAGLCLYEDLIGHEQNSVESIILSLEKSVLEEVRRGSWEIAWDLMMQMIDVYEGAGHRLSLAQQRIFEVLIIVTRMLQELGMDVKKPYYPGQAAGYAELKAETRVLLGKLSDAADITIGGMDSDLFVTMKQYIREHAHEDLSLEKLAATVNRNPFYVSKLFKEVFGTNYIDFLTECRMETAKQLMQETDKSLKEITFEIGYNDPNYFSRVFKKIVGISPTDYRKLLLRPTHKPLIHEVDYAGTGREER